MVAMGSVLCDLVAVVEVVESPMAETSLVREGEKDDVLEKLDIQCPGRARRR